MQGDTLQNIQPGQGVTRAHPAWCCPHSWAGLVGAAAGIAWSQFSPSWSPQIRMKWKILRPWHSPHTTWEPGTAAPLPPALTFIFHYWTRVSVGCV